MFQMIAQIEAEPLVLMSIAKPVILLATFGAWAWFVGRLDKDAGFYYAKQQRWGMAHLGAGVLALGVMVFVPIFWVGWVLGLMILVGEASGYVAYRNTKVPEEDRWRPMDIPDRIGNKHRRDRQERAKEQAQVNLIDKSGALMEVPQGEDPRAAAFELFQDLLVFAVPRGADRIDITVTGEKANFIVRVDGIRISQPAPERELCLKLIDYLKQNAGMELGERRRKQTGNLAVEVEGYDKHKINLTTSGSTRVIQLVIEFDLEDKHKIPLDELGLMPWQLKAIKEAIQKLSKVIIFASPPGTGTTTTMCAVLAEHDPYTSSVMTFEKKSPFTMEGVNHNYFAEGATKEQITEQFASLLRSDPNVVMVEQIVSPEMAKLIATHSEDARFYIALPAKDTLSALKLWIKIVGDKHLAAESVDMVISQRLPRRLCVNCRAPYDPDDAAIKKLKMSKNDTRQLYKASGKVYVKEDPSPCPDCHGLGYRGRIGGYEIMVLDQDARTLVASGEGDRLRSYLRKRNMVYLQEASLNKVVEGITDIKEATRVMDEHDKD